MCKTSSPFIDYLNSKKKSLMFKTPLQLSGIKSVSSANGASQQPPKTPHQHTPINELSVIENLPKKKLFEKFESSSILKTSSDHCSPALSEISSNPLNDKLNCTDLDCRRFTLDISEIGDINESNYIKPSTNRKEMNRLIEDLVEEEEEEIKKLDLDDTNDEIKDEENHLNEIYEEVNHKEEKIVNEIVNAVYVEDAHMSVSIQPDLSMMECSFHTAENESSSNNSRNIKSSNVNELLMNDHQINEPNQYELDQQTNHLINHQANHQLNSEIVNINESNEQMETSMICSLDMNNFNDKIDPTIKSSFKNQLTSTPFRF